jgi:tetratricopeptide (TPR) repeat protein
VGFIPLAVRSNARDSMLSSFARRAATGSRPFPFLVAMAILGCAARPDATPPEPLPVPVAPVAAGPVAPSASAARPGTMDGIPEVPITGALMYQLMAAELAAQQGELGAAYSIYLKLARETRDPRLARRAAELALQGRALPQSVEAAELWRQLAPDSREAGQALAVLYASTGRFDEAYTLLAAEVKAAASPAAELSRIQRQLARAQDRQGTFKLLERLAQPYLNSAEVRLVLASGANAAGMTARASEEAKAAVALQPDSERAALAAAQFLQNTDRAAALELLQRQVARSGASAEVRLAYARLLVADRQYGPARAQFELLQQADPKNPDLVYSLALLSLQGNLRAEARTYLLRYLDLLQSQPSEERDPDQAFLYLAQLAEDDKQYDDALRWLRKIEGGDEFIPARVREALVLAKMQRVDEARKLLRGVQANSPDERLQLVLAEAQLLRETRRYDEASKLLAQALEKTPDNIALLYDSAMTAEKLDRIDAMERQLRRVIELKPDYAHAYNALGYTFADRNVRLPEALQLIEKAHQLAPEDPFILDSLGWVYFRMGDLPQARKYLELAYDAKPDAEVTIHLAEVLWSSGDQARARTLLREARAKEPGNELLKSTLARLRIGL